MTATIPLRYLTADEVCAINVAVLGQEEISLRLLNSGALDGALMRPQTAARYVQVDVIAQAASLIAAIAAAHAFLDGNKRTAMIAGAVFLDLNGYVITADPSNDTLGRQVEALVIHSHQNADVATERFCDWLRLYVTPKP